MKKQILDFVRDRDGGVSFAELERHLGEAFKGERLILAGDNDSLIVWINVSDELIQSIEELLSAGAIEATTTSPLLYFIDGLVPNLPVAQRPKHHYKDPHWLPVVLNLGDAAWDSECEGVESDDD